MVKRTTAKMVRDRQFHHGLRLRDCEAQMVGSSDVQHSSVRSQRQKSDLQTAGGAWESCTRNECWEEECLRTRRRSKLTLIRWDQASGPSAVCDAARLAKIFFNVCFHAISQQDHKATINRRVKRWELISTVQLNTHRERQRRVVEIFHARRARKMR